jgi:hypothetical protein
MRGHDGIWAAGFNLNSRPFPEKTNGKKKIAKPHNKITLATPAAGE